MAHLLQQRDQVNRERRENKNVGREGGRQLPESGMAQCLGQRVVTLLTVEWARCPRAFPAKHQVQRQAHEQLRETVIEIGFSPADCRTQFLRQRPEDRTSEPGE